MRARAALAVLLLGVGANGSAQTPAPAPEPFELRHATLDLVIDFPNKSLSGSMALDLENWTPQPARAVSFLLNRLMEVSRVTDATGTAATFTQDVVRMSDDPMRQVTLLSVNLPHDVAPGARTTVRIEYAGYVAPYADAGWLYVRDHVDTAFTIIRGEALAYPSLGGRSSAANRKIPSPEFTYDASIRVPAGFLVATGGAVTRTAHDDGTITWRYVSGRPSGVMNVSIAPFDTLAAGGVRLFYLRADSLGARRVMASTQTAMHTLAEWFGPLHDAVNLTITEIPDGWGSQADLVGGIIQSAAAFRDAGRLGELYHELTHLWNAPDVEHPSPRWNEGLASFLEGVLREDVDGWRGRPAYEAALLKWIAGRIAGDSAVRTVPFIDYGKRDMTGWSYSTGEVMFATLRDLVGAAEFNQIVGGYYQKYAAVGGSTRDFVNFARHAAPENLSPFFDDWMFTPRWTGLVAGASSIKEIAEHYRSSR